MEYIVSEKHFQLVASQLPSRLIKSLPSLPSDEKEKGISMSAPVAAEAASLNKYHADVKLYMDCRLHTVKNASGQ